MSSESKPWRNKELLNELYHGKEMTLEEVGGELGCSAPTVRKWLDKFGLGTRSIQEVRKKEWILEPIGMQMDSQGYEIFRPQWENEREQVYHHRLIAVALYGIEEVKEKEVHHESGVKWDNRHSNINLLTSSEHITEHMDDLTESRPGSISKELCETFREEYPDKTGEELANEYGTSQATVSYHATGECRH